MVAGIIYAIYHFKAINLQFCLHIFPDQFEQVVNMFKLKVTSYWLHTILPVYIFQFGYGYGFLYKHLCGVPALALDTFPRFISPSIDWPGNHLFLWTTDIKWPSSSNILFGFSRLTLVLSLIERYWTRCKQIKTLKFGCIV